jgi:hypothetical protein
MSLIFDFTAAQEMVAQMDMDGYKLDNMGWLEMWANNRTWAVTSLATKLKPR